MDMPTVYQISEKSFCFQPQHRPESFEVTHLMGGEYAVRVRRSPTSAEVVSEVLLKISEDALSVRQNVGEDLHEQDFNFLRQLPKMFAFLGIEDGESKKFNKLFYGLFWEAVSLKAQYL